MPASPVSRQSRRFPRFSVRGLIVVVVLIGAGLGWLVRSARIQRDAVATIERSVGSASYDWQYRDGIDIRGGMPWAPPWLVDLVGVDYFGHVTSVSLNGELSDDALVHAGRLTQLESLDLAGSSVCDAELAHLTGLTNLSTLDLQGTQITELGLAHLKGLSNLSYLRLAYTGISHAGLEHVKRLTSLSGLDLRGTTVTDAGMKGLRKALPKLDIEY
jgi:Leucine rich repeat